MIASAAYDEFGGVTATIDGVAVSMPNDMANRYRRMVADWEAEGNTITPYLPAAITPDQVTAEAQRRINAASGDARVNLQVFGTPVPADITALCAAIRTKGEALAAMSPIPRNYQDDSYWS